MCTDDKHMSHAIELATRGEGSVEPNPMVGCVIVKDGVRIGEGWHREWGGPHAEVEALQACDSDVTGATMYVTLEPCCHTGKTPPCTEALLRAGIGRVVVAQTDPFPAVAGQGIERLRGAGLRVDVGVLEQAARQLNAPYRMLIQHGRPWIIAKWAMTLDGKIASRTGHSRWISNERARGVVRQLRGRVDAIMVGRQTALADDPLLTAQPPGPRTATRIVADTHAALPPTSRLVQSSRTAPVLVAVGETVDQPRQRVLEEAGCEVLACPGVDAAERLQYLIWELGRRRMTNLLVEGGGQLLGSLFDRHWVDEVHVFVAAKLVGGRAAPGPVAGFGADWMPPQPSLLHPRIEVLDQDVYIWGRLRDASHGEGN
jgi:diaminohydroxyphosphoribosylaminopyrimidine deaminase/5-amino-6-(5-phosphoribosylamino)uracil reductase